MIASTYPVSTIEEKDIGQYLMTSLPEYVFVRKNNQNNFYVYNDLHFYDITDQQQHNDYNIAVGCINAVTMGAGKQKDISFTNDTGDEVLVHYGDIMLKTFEFHVWSVNKNNSETFQFAEMVRLAMKGYKDLFNLPSVLSSYYKKLDNTTKPLYDCVFTCEILVQETFATSVGIFDDATIDIVKVSQS